MSHRAVIGLGIALGLANAGLFFALQRLPVGVALVLQNLAPVFVIGVDALARRRMPSGRVIAGVLTALAGVVLVAKVPGARLGSLDRLGIGFGILTAAALATFTILGGRVSRAYGVLGATARAFTVSAVGWIIIQAPQGVPAAVDHPTCVLRRGA